MDFSQFHFLRPYWLWLLIPAALICWSAWTRQDPLQSWKGVISDHLLPALLQRDVGKGGWFKPVYLLSVLWLAGVFALAGPTWKLEPTPFAEDESALFVLIKVTPEMLAEDVQPTRLQRAVQKIHDLLEIKTGQRYSLIAYAGSAHLAMPLTSDADIINTFAAALEPEIMPVEGDAVGDAVALANRRLKEAGLPGTILLFADAVEPTQIEVLAAQRQQGGAPVHILAMAAGADVIPPLDSPPAPPLNEANLRAAADASDGSLTLLTPDDSDVRRLASRAERGLMDAPAQEGQHWKDMGYFLLPLIVLALLVFFRQGGALALD